LGKTLMASSDLSCSHTKDWKLTLTRRRSGAIVRNRHCGRCGKKFRTIEASPLSIFTSYMKSLGATLDLVSEGEGDQNEHSQQDKG